MSGLTINNEGGELVIYANLHISDGFANFDKYHQEMLDRGNLWQFCSEYEVRGDVYMTYEELSKYSDKKVKVAGAVIIE